MGVGGNKDQPVPVRPGQRDLRPGGREVQAHPIQGLQAHPPPPGQIDTFIINNNKNIIG